MNKRIMLLTERLKIKTLHISDITLEYINGLNDPEVNKYLVNVRLQKQTKKTVADFISSNLKSPHDLFLGVFLKKEDIFIGTVRITDISYFHYLCTVGICFFNKKYWGKGYALEALNKTVELIFNKLGMHYIEAGVYFDNIASLNLFKRAGFSVKSVHKDKFRYASNFKEVRMFGKINGGFDNSRLS